MRVVRPNRTKRLLKSGGVAIGVSIASPAPELVEIAAVAGCDYAILDAEHEPFDDAQLANLIRAADAFDITPIRTAYFVCSTSVHREFTCRAALPWRTCAN